MTDLDIADVRVKALGEYMLQMLKLKPDRFMKPYSLEDVQKMYISFFENTDRKMLYVYVAGSGMVAADATWPGNPKIKGYYFVKKKPEKIAMSPNFKKTLIYGEMSPFTVDHFSTLVEEVLVPLFSNNKNYANWPKVVSQDVSRHVNALKCSVFMVAGQARGQTLLPFPVGIEKPEFLEELDKSENFDPAIVHAIETVVIEWSHQLHEVMKHDSKETVTDKMTSSPFVEIQFWETKFKNLSGIYNQFCDGKVEKMAKILEISESSYCHAFKSMFKEVISAYREAYDVNLHLTPLKNRLEELESAEYEECAVMFRAIMHTLCLIWANSFYYNVPARLVTILQEICHMLIEKARGYFSPEEILKKDPEETIPSIKKGLQILYKFKKAFEEHKNKIETYFKEPQTPRLWSFNSSLIFARFDSFVYHVETVLALMESTIEFEKLEKIELGGIKGRVLSELVFNVYNESKEEFRVFTESSFDPLSPEEPMHKYSLTRADHSALALFRLKDNLYNSSKEFMDKYKIFLTNIEDMQLRLGTIITKGVDDCYTPEAVFKIIIMMSGLLKQPLIANAFECKYPILMEMLEAYLDRTKAIVDRQLACVRTGKDRPYIHKNMPPTAGLLRWGYDIRERIGRPMTQFGRLKHKCVTTEEAKLLFVKYNEIIDLLDQFESEAYDKWIAGVDEACSFNLAQPLITRNKKTNLISVNFDPKLVAVLREVKYIMMREKEGIPPSAQTLFEQNDKFFKYVANLDMTVRWYNKVRREALDVEFPLIQGQLAQLDKELRVAESDLHWKDPAVWDYIQKVRDAVHDLETRVQKCKCNVETIQHIMTTWTSTPLYERKEEKSTSYLFLADRTERCAKRYGEIAAAGQRIHDLVKENLELFKAKENTPTWMAYVDYVDDAVVDGFEETLTCSLQFFMDNTDLTKSPEPLYPAKMELIVPEIVFTPGMDYSAHGSLYKLMEGLLKDVYRQASNVRRLSLTSGDKDYEREMEMTDDLTATRDEILERVTSVMNQAIDYRSSFDTYSYLWVDDRVEFMRQFLLYNHVPTQEEIEAHAETGMPESPPTLAQFKAQIDSYEKIYEETQGIEGKKYFDCWLLVNSEPFKQGLINTIKTWSLMFKQHLIDHVTNSLQELEMFIKKADVGLATEVKEGDFESLVKVMGYLMDVRERMAETDDMFEPLKQMIELLKTYNQEMPESVYIQLQNLPEMWANTKKTAITTKQAIAPLQANEVMNIQRKVASFDVTQHKYREKFRALEFFRSTCTKPYELLDKTQAEIFDMEEVMNDLVDSAQLFAVAVPEYKQLKFSRKEIRFLKQLWDYVGVVSSTFDEWNNTQWSDINVEQMDVDCKKLAKDIRGLDKEMRAWDVYTALEDSVKNMITSLKAIGDLQNPSIRDRHWQQLMEATGVKFTMNEKTVLLDLLKLNLHKFEEEVRNIVDKAIKETGMEKLLKELDVTWRQMEFEHLDHPRTGITLLKTSDELVETLEDNQSQVQNMMSSKYIAHFLKEVSQWQVKLSTADQVVTIYMEVQRTWQHLESIFIGSEDIRNQLPEDSERFSKVDGMFKNVVKKMTVSKNVVKATNQRNLYETLDFVQTELAKCEKALAEYLETKRLAFPRFYFVSSADLLDILSNGNSPPSVMKHLTKLFDSLAKLKLIKDSKGKEIKSANGMWSKDGEYVDLAKTCDLNGQVENWLNNVLDAMILTVRHEMSEGIITYEDKPRDEWLFDYPAQVALCGTQIWWTTEVNQTFARLEEGFENSMKDYNKKQIQQLNSLITRLIGDLSRGDRQKIMTICTIDVHARDVVSKMILQKVDNSQAFVWLSQLRHRWDDKERDCFANICDAQLRYSHEYLGNTPRLVITPLTDRCYITLTQSLHLIMGGAPAGPAGTGKTETTKDLGRALGIMVYVFNCSEQMDYKSVGNIYKGLAQSGTWGCFDEFNRIAVEVLSVIAVQVKSIQDAIRDKKKTFNFMGEIISIKPTVGIWITMNPGYAGRTELPENLKALFRPCAMVVPDFELICEIMLVAEGFMEARLLARKFITLYSLCKELLSKQDHYDWGLRAIKSVLVVAGALKRGDRGRPEDQVLMRALRDFNVPKIVVEDMPVFMGLIGDLFPALDVPRKRDFDLEKSIHSATVQSSLQPEDNFILKLQELFEVRHSVFLLGAAGTGKSRVWTTLQRTYKNMGRKPTAVILDPKSVSNDELFGIINPATREWKDGLFAVVMRDLANMSGDGPKWIVLDGDIDPMWIESLNTVMDDNKILTLASNERIPLTPSMRLLFEISHLKTATPATVSRAGILFINITDLGWNPFVQSWIENRESQTERANLTVLFERYVPVLLDVLKGRFKKITPIVEIAHVQMLCHLLECMLTPDVITPESPKEWYELYFVFACVWAFGGVLFQDQLADHRVEFTKWWVTDLKTVKFPSHGTLFDYYIDPDTKKFEPWTKLVPVFEYDPDMPLQAALVHTTETTRTRYFLDMLIAKQRPVMLVGNAGTGKTVLMQDKLLSLSKDDYAISNVPFNFYTTSMLLQLVLEKPLEKKAGRNYGPPGSKRLIYFVDDLNMPEVDQYFTVQPHTFMRQHIDHHHWYDRYKLSLKEIHNTQYVACMNPTAGSFTIDPRLQRHFCVFAMSFPNKEALSTIYSSILSQHLAHANFAVLVQRFAVSLVGAALALHNRIATSFLPTAIKFHYVFNLRDLSNIFQGMLFAGGDCAKNQWELVRLWLHECSRVYRDKLVDKEDIDMFDKIAKDVVKKTFEDVDDAIAFFQPNLYCHFALGIGEPKYMPVSDWASLNKLLTEALDSYNEMNAAMNLVLFEDAMMHICRINRILESPRGNALLIGVGGSGKQSLSRLSASISSLEVFQITLRKGYGITDLKNDLAELYRKAGVKGVGIMFLMTDSQVADEKFLVLINDLLASGEIPGLFGDDQLDELYNAVRADVKNMGLDDTRENCWAAFIDKVRRLLKVVLCFSPVGNTLRVRSRKFPAVTNCTSIDWFHEWPEEALVSVSGRFLEENEFLSPDARTCISKFMAFVHKSVNELSQEYMSVEKRYNYTTPKSFLEQITLYQNLLSKKFGQLQASISRLENGMEKLRNTAAQVDDLKEKLAAQEVVVAQKNEDANKLIQVVGAEKEKVGKEKAIADEEEKKVSVITKEVQVKQEDCARDLAKAEPALQAAEAALNTLNKNNLTEMKAFGSPPAAVVNVVSAVMCLLAPGGKVPKDKSWKNAKATIMSKVDQFLNDLIYYDKDHIPDECLKAVKPFLADPDFNAEFIAAKSTAAAGLCSWVVNIVTYYHIFCEVEPKRNALQQATDDMLAAQEKLRLIKEKVAALQATLAVCQAQFERAINEKIRCQQEAEATGATISLANRLVGGLASENVRWAAAIDQFRKNMKMLPGDVMLITAFISYVGSFTKKYRTALMDSHWLPTIRRFRETIPITDGLDPLTLLIDDAIVAGWSNEGLPMDRMSIENATILTSCERWPLMIDPQLQGIKWIKLRYGEDLKVTRLGAKGYLDIIESAVCNGDVVLLENIGESMDPVLDSLLGRNTIKKGRAIKMGDKEVEYNPTFRLILQTKLANPHYKPEMQAQTTLINFTVTRDGLEDQLLGAVVAKERPDLEELKSELTRQQNQFKITLKELEDNLLARLSSAGEDILSDTALVENLEITKKTAAEIAQKAEEAKNTEVEINTAREGYRPAAARASLLYFIMNDLHKIHPMYQFSLKAFSVVFSNAIDRAEPAEDVKTRVKNLISSITFLVFIYTTRGLFEKDKLIFTAQMTFQILLVSKDIEPSELDFLLRYPANPNVVSPVDFLTNICWGGVKTLAEKDEFRNLDKDIEGSAKRWKTFVEHETPEREKFPQEWKNKTSLQKLCMMRCLRPDRMSYAVSGFVEEKLGKRYVESYSLPFAVSYEESGPGTPVFFILSPGVDPLKDVEALGKKLGFTGDLANFHNISLGQGQEVVAETAMEQSARQGEWVVLQNVHLVARWLPKLEKIMEVYAAEGDPRYRLYISAEPAASADSHIIPQGILESAIKITNEPPTGMFANVHKALNLFSQETLEMCAKETEFKSILFCLCYFHAVVCERRKFGPQGWNRNYPFNVGDLTISVSVLFNYLENTSKVPWEDLRYLFGEIMYGGHITDDWDRRLCRTYLEVFMQNAMLDGELYLAPDFPVPPNMDYNGYHNYLDENLPPETPVLYGLHPNSEIEFLTQLSENLFKTVFELQPRDAGAGAGGGVSREEKVKAILDDCNERMPEPFTMEEIMAKVPIEERTPYVVVAFQECERMNILTSEIRRSLKELNLGLKGELTITSDMEDLSNALFMDKVPETWSRRAYPALYSLGVWYADLLLRIKELENWTGDFALPAAVWLAGFFNPQSFLTAIMQQMARKNEWPLDRMVLQCDVTKKSREDMAGAPREGAYIHGLYMEGARWDTPTGMIAESRLKELTPQMPVVFLKAIPVDRQDLRNIYDCPVYKTKFRGPTFVWTFNLKTKEKPSKWTLGGVAILLQV